VLLTDSESFLGSGKNVLVAEVQEGIPKGFEEENFCKAPRG
jgi:hypothetical protein